MIHAKSDNTLLQGSYNISKISQSPFSAKSLVLQRDFHEGTAVVGQSRPAGFQPARTELAGWKARPTIKFRCSTGSLSEDTQPRALVTLQGVIQCGSLKGLHYGEDECSDNLLICECEHEVKV